MKKPRSILRLLLTATLLLSSLPAMACESSCSTSHGSMACAMRCAHAGSMATSGSKSKPVLRTNCCRGASQTESVAVILAPSSPQKLVVLEATVLPASVVVVVEVVQVSREVAAAVPVGQSSYLSSQHHFANAPPSLI